ncbi:hypothetical protein [Piscirickettsia salmonis]|uniref:hypothetical protein n=1 Tax=Piscirickettsia salmonis TaxID=1238 RepID=UPI0012BACB2A|nr:hypothetical protein [Piscirickettsia salmonis]
MDVQNTYRGSDAYVKSFTFYHSNSLLTSVDCYTIPKSKFFATVPHEHRTFKFYEQYMDKHDGRLDGLNLTAQPQ